MKQLIVMTLAIILILPLSIRAENDSKQIFELERALLRTQQDAQATYQQFLMIQELRRNEMQSPSLDGLPADAGKSTSPPRYEEMIQRQQDRKKRVEQYTVDLDQLYIRYRALEDERQMIMEQIIQLEQQQSE